ncbi:hypothetical protein M2318_005285 [Metapseudomonas resinovorans]|uniref:DUF1654 domain-containing protein n=1 Tax=Metapseudomonas resinovorans TaxID=53412 RepID=UPI003D1E4AC3
MEAHSLAHRHVDSYARLVRRIHSVVHSRLAQAEHQAVIRREPDEAQEDWDRLIDEIRGAEMVRITPRPDGSLHLAWFVSLDT